MYPVLTSNAPARSAAESALERARQDRDRFLRYFGFRQPPFGVTPDPGLLFFSKIHRAALDAIIQSIESNLGFTVLLGAPGTGKTTLLFQLLTKYRDCARTAFIYQTQCNPHDLLRYIASELELPGRMRDEVSLHERLKGILVEEARAGRKVLIIIDEAQNLQHSSLEAIRLLSDFETESAKLLHIILAGSSRLSETLLAPELSQLAQRVFTVCRLEPLALEEVKAYVSFRLEASGCRVVRGLFSPESLAEITERSGGVPRLINAICYRSLLLAFRRGERHVSPSLVHQSVRELELSESAGMSSRPSDQWPATGKQDGCSQAKNITSAEKDTPPEPYKTGLELPSTSSAPKIELRPNAAGSVANSSDKERASRIHNQAPNNPTSSSGHSMAGRAAQTDSFHRPANRVRVLRPVRSRHSRTIDSYSIVVGAMILLALGLWTGWHELEVKLLPSQESSSSIQAQAGSDANSDANKQRDARSSATLPAAVPITTGESNRGPAHYTRTATPTRPVTLVIETVPDGMLLPSRIIPPRSRPADAAIPNNVTAVSRDSELPMLPLASVPPSVPKLNGPVATDHPRNVAPAPFPHPTKVVQPEYPNLAKLRRIEGDVVLELQIDSNGNVRTVRTVSGNILLRKAAEDAARQWQYPPSPEDAFSSPAVTRVRINFKLDPDAKR